MNAQVARALRRLQKERRTGVFRSSLGGADREIFFDHGAIVGARSSVPEERLGEVMLRHGRIDEAQLQRASRLLQTGRRRLGEALVELGIVEQADVDAFIRTQLAEITSQLMIRPPRKLQFRNSRHRGRVTERPVLVADAILEAARRTREIDPYLERMLDDDQIPRITTEAGSILAELGLKSNEAFVLSRCDGFSRLRDIFAQSPLAEDDTARILLGLEQAGIIEMVDAQAGT